ncbi:MAG: DEAD/DEAH box helicase, partial [Erythrobacter sp.]|uniref:DEAD/DEAH box helicase n=1 Tax=Erythrobacter sp. TaxID=1042 RepID=UPI003296E821
VNKDRNKLHRGTDILIATPGRLLDLIDQKAFNLNSVEVLVLDEADQMMDLGFVHALRRINELVPKERQTLFFSATMPKAIKELVKNYCRNPVQVSVTPESTTAERVEQYIFMVQKDEKQSLLDMILSGRHRVPGNFERILIFTRTKHGADRVVKKLRQSGIESNAIHGNKSQPQRQRALDEFRRGKTSVLIATDVAARGIDIPGVSHVINYELPNVPEQYVHRIGRTARAGKDGVAIAFCGEDERSYLKDIRKVTKVELDRLDLPENFRAVVEGEGPTKPETRGATRVSKKKVRPRPAGQNPSKGQGADDGSPKSKKPKPKHGARKGKPQGKLGGRPQGGKPGGQRPGGKPGGSRRRHSGGGGGGGGGRPRQG